MPRDPETIYLLRSMLELYGGAMETEQNEELERLAATTALVERTDDGCKATKEGLATIDVLLDEFAAIVELGKKCG